MKYKDKDGKILYGYSQVSLDENNKRLKQITYVLWAFFILIIFMIAYIIQTEAVGHIINSIGKVC